MSDKALVEKLAIKQGSRILFVSAPRGYKASLGAMPKKTTIVNSTTEPVDVIQVFVSSRKELETELARLKSLLTPDGILWVTYYKGTSQHQTDINRDSIYAYARRMGLQGVAMISVDENWSALRLKKIGSA